MPTAATRRAQALSYSITPAMRSKTLRSSRHSFLREGPGAAALDEGALFVRKRGTDAAPAEVEADHARIIQRFPFPVHRHYRDQTRLNACKHVVNNGNRMISYTKRRGGFACGYTVARERKYLRVRG